MQRPSGRQQLAGPSPAAAGTHLAHQAGIDALLSLASGNQPDLMGLANAIHTDQVTAAQVHGAPQVQVEGPPLSKAEHTAAQRAIKLSARYLGTPYKWGGADPRTGFDCSGLVQWVYRQNGKSLPRTTYQQWAAGKQVKGALRPGDVVFFDMGPQGPGHEGLYIGHGRFIQSPHTGDVIKVSRLKDYRRAYAGARRF